MSPTPTGDPLRPVPRARIWTWIWTLVVIAIVVAVIVWFSLHAAHSGAGDGAGGPPGAGAGRAGKKGGGRPISVGVAKVSRGKITVYLNQLGTVTSLATATVHSQISGQLMEIRFTEGDLVKAGVPIALIDPRPYQAQLTQFEGTLEHDEALLDNARLDLTRYKTLIAQDSTSRQIYDTQVALVKQDEGTVKSDEGQIATIKLDLVYCNVVSPVTGRIGLRQVDVGNYVTPGDTNGIAVVSQITPISVEFTVPEDDIPTLVTATAGGKILPVEALDRAAQRHLATGNLSALDNQIDTTTGTVKLRAQFANDDASLFPNQFVNVKLPVQTFDNALVVPTSAIEHGSNGTFVYVVGPADAAPAAGANGAPAADAKHPAPDTPAAPSGDKPPADQPAKPAFKVTMKPVKLGATEGERVLIQSGVDEGDEVVTDGADQLKDGQTVTIAAPPAGGDDASASSTHHHKKKPASTTPGQAPDAGAN